MKNLNKNKVKIVVNSNINNVQINTKYVPNISTSSIKKPYLYISKLNKSITLSKLNILEIQHNLNTNVQNNKTHRHLN